MASFLLYHIVYMAPELSHTNFSRPSKPITDIVGLELGVAHSEGVPAVRLTKRAEGNIELVSAGFLKLSGAQIPEVPDPEKTPPVWFLPKAFQAPYAALTVSSPQGFLRHASGLGDEIDKKQLSFRTVKRISATDLPPLVAGLPEFQAAWVARLLPEGHHPTARSIQFTPVASLNALSASPAFSAVSGTATALFVFPKFTAVAAFQNRDLVLYREHPVGYYHLRKAIAERMGIDIGLIDAVLDDHLIDPTPIIEPILRPLFRQVEISTDFLLRRRNYKPNDFFLCGLPAGARYWSDIFSTMMEHPLNPVAPLDGVLRIPRKKSALPTLSIAQQNLLMAAYGAAYAVLEDV